MLKLNKIPSQNGCRDRNVCGHKGLPVVFIMYSSRSEETYWECSELFCILWSTFICTTIPRTESIRWGFVKVSALMMLTRWIMAEEIGLFTTRPSASCYKHWRIQASSGSSCVRPLCCFFFVGFLGGEPRGSYNLHNLHLFTMKEMVFDIFLHCLKSTFISLCFVHI